MDKASRMEKTCVWLHTKSGAIFIASLVAVMAVVGIVLVTRSTLLETIHKAYGPTAMIVFMVFCVELRFFMEWSRKKAVSMLERTGRPRAMSLADICLVLPGIARADLERACQAVPGLSIVDKPSGYGGMDVVAVNGHMALSFTNEVYRRKSTGGDYASSACNGNIVRAEPVDDLVSPWEYETDNVKALKSLVSWLTPLKKGDVPLVDENDPWLAREAT